MLLGPVLCIPSRQPKFKAQIADMPVLPFRNFLT
jgi:hypothetical protein